MDRSVVQMASVFSAGVVVASLAAAVTQAPNEAQTAAQTTVLCVKKGSQTVRWPKGTTCKKGWTKRTLTSTGAAGPAGPKGDAGSNGTPGQTGPAGPSGPELEVTDAKGDVVGIFRGYSEVGASPKILVARGGGIFTYSAGGRLEPSGVARYTTPNCTGDAYVVTAIPMADELTTAAGSDGRVVVRTTIPAYGTPRAYRLTSQWEGLVNITTYLPTTQGGCTNQGALTQALVDLEPVTVPPDYVGPLKVG